MTGGVHLPGSRKKSLSKKEGGYNQQSKQKFRDSDGIEHPQKEQSEIHDSYFIKNPPQKATASVVSNIRCARGNGDN
jgi:hypothetical protein